MVTQGGWLPCALSNANPFVFSVPLPPTVLGVWVWQVQCMHPEPVQGEGPHTAGLLPQWLGSETARHITPRRAQSK